MLCPMRFFTRQRHEVEQTSCRHPLVVHADGTHECEGATWCELEELLHDWWLPCDELSCGCVGAEHDLTVGFALPLAA